jgi:ABC-2 type transport system permease protein
MELANGMTNRYRFLDRMRIVLALAQKDISGMLRSRAVLTTLVMVLVMITFYMYLPAWAERSEPPTVYVTGVLNTPIGRELELIPTLSVYQPQDENRMMHALRESEIPELGLILPADLVEQAQAQGQAPLIVQGYVMYWLSPEEVSSLTDAAELELTTLLDRPVSISVEGNVLYPEVGNYGKAVMVGFSLVFALTLVGVTGLPQLMMEEKQSHTLQALLVSPATPTMIILGKALAGMFFITLAFLFSLMFYASMVLHWWVLLVSCLLFSVFSVGIGLAGGTYVENRQQLALLVWGVAPLVFIPMIAILLEGLLPDWVVTLGSFLPGAALINAISLAFVGELPLTATLFPLGVLAIWAAVMLALVIWRLRRYDR